MKSQNSVVIIGAGLAGCEAAYTLAKAGTRVKLYDMKPGKKSPAHSEDNLAELVCSNSLGAERLSSAPGLLKAEMRMLGSLLLDCADKTKVAAGGALAVDRERFSKAVTDAVKNHPLIALREEEVKSIPEGWAIIATGPLTSDDFAQEIANLCGGEYLSFYDAAAPIVMANSLDYDKVFRASRYGRGGDDYINCPFDRQEYESFYREIIAARPAQLSEFDQSPKVYEGCMPVEVMAKRGEDTLRYGPLKPVGLNDPKTGRRPWAVAQLRAENAQGTMYNLVGFQTNLAFQEQKRVFSMIPGLENAEFARFGVMHRNTFLDSPRLLSADFSLKKKPQLFFAGQITGTEGYMESAAGGIIAAHQLMRKMREQEPIIFPPETMLGAFSRYISDESVKDFQPMGANMGLLPPLGEKIRDKQERYLRIAERSLELMEATIR